MKDEKNTDNIFREKLENFKVPPPPHIWDNVQVNLIGIRQRNRLRYIGWISAAAVVILAFLAGWYFNDNSNIDNSVSVKNEIVQEEKSTIETSVLAEEKVEQNTLAAQADNFESKDIDFSKTTHIAAVSKVDAKASYTNSELTDKNTRENFEMAMLESADFSLVQNQLIIPELSVHIKTTPNNTFTKQEQLLIAENINNIKVASKPENNWKMGMYVAPGYSSYTADHAESYANNMTNSGSDGNANVSGGVSVQYKTSKRWIVESGVYYAQNGQVSNNSVGIFALNREADMMYAPADVNYFTNTVQVENNNIAMNSTAGVIAFSATPKGAELSGDFDESRTSSANLIVPDGQFSQVFEFMEIPLYVRYRVVDSKFGIELITGLNAGIVVGNNAYIETQYGSQNIGQTSDISPVNLSGTLGVGINYGFGKHFAIALEPRFNYYLNSINSNPSVDFRPYRLGFFTGVSYEF